MNIITYGSSRIILAITDIEGEELINSLKSKDYFFAGIASGASLLCDKTLLEFCDDKFKFDFIMQDGSVLPVLVDGNETNVVSFDALNSIKMSQVVNNPEYEYLGFGDYLKNEFIKLCRFENTNTPYTIAEYTDSSEIAQHIFTYNKKKVSKVPLNTLAQETPTSKLQIELPFFNQIRNREFIIPALDYFNPLPKPLTLPTFRNSLPNYLESYLEEDIIGYTDNDNLGIQPNEQQMYDSLKYLIDCSLEYEVQQRQGDADISVEKLKDMGFKSPTMDLFFTNFALSALVKTRPHIGFVYYYPSMIDASGIDDDLTEDDSATDIEGDGRRYVNPYDSSLRSKEVIEAAIEELYNKPDVRRQLEELANNSSNPYAWAEIIIKLLRWGERKPRNLIIEGLDSNICLDLETFELKRTDDLNLVEYSDEEGYNRFPEGVIYAKIKVPGYIKLKSRISPEVFNELMNNSGFIEIPISLVCKVKYTNIDSSEIVKETIRLVDFYTLGESINKSNGVKVKGINYSTLEVDPYLEELFQQGKSDVINNVKEYAKWMKALSSGVKYDISEKERELVIRFNSLSYQEQNIINFAKILFEDSNNTFFTYSKMCANYTTNDEIVEMVGNSRDVGLIEAIKIMDEMHILPLFILWMHSNTLHDIIVVTSKTTQEKQETQSKPKPEPQLEQSSAFSKPVEEVKKVNVKAIMDSSRIYGYISTEAPFRLFLTDESDKISCSEGSMSIPQFKAVATHYLKVKETGDLDVFSEFDEDKLRKILIEVMR